MYFSLSLWIPHCQILDLPTKNSIWMVICTMWSWWIRFESNEVDWSNTEINSRGFKLNLRSRGLIQGEHIDWLVWHEEKEWFMFKSREEDSEWQLYWKNCQMEIAKGNDFWCLFVSLSSLWDKFWLAQVWCRHNESRMILLEFLTIEESNHCVQRSSSPRQMEEYIPHANGR
jgi:hypothetical protein